MVGDVENAPPSTLYFTSKLVTGVTLGRLNAALQVLTGATITGAVGNIVTLTVLLAPHAPGPAVLVVVLPQAADTKYSACIV